uniref:Uncharacterized protein n=1 Tax=viral metagenome TaxID=1070528 RepID=A0A6C0EP43_9ZZZZ
MESWWAYVIGTVAFFYIQSFNRVATMYFKSDQTLSWDDLFTKVIPIRNSQFEDRTQDLPLRRRTL